MVFVGSFFLDFNGIVLYCCVQGESKKTDSFEMQISRTKSLWYKTYQISALLIDLRQKSNSLSKLKSL